MPAENIVLDQALLEDIDAHAAHLPHRKAACIDALRLVQKRYGWVSHDAVREIASFLGMTPDEVDGVATFYNLVFRKPVGQHVILVCDSVSCWISGHESLLSSLRAVLAIEPGQTSSDGMFTLLPVPCLGACDHAPALMLDGVLHGDMTAKRVEELVRQVRGEEG